jgi:hypothetical protein
MEVWKLNYGEEKAEWEKRLEEYLKPTDEIERIEGELKEYGVEQRKPENNPGNPIIPAVDWRKLSSMDILGSIEVALRVLRERKLTAEEKKYAATIAKDLIDIASDPPGGSPEREEEEYEEVRRRARAISGPKLFPV